MAELSLMGGCQRPGINTENSSNATLLPESGGQGPSAVETNPFLEAPGKEVETTGGGRHTAF